MAEARILSTTEFRKLQLAELQLLKEFDRVCRINDIDYVIAFGSMLGAVRHKGFIPWDDDIDVILLREDYEKFRACSNQLNSDICFFQDHYNDPTYFWGYGKIRKTGTTYIRAGQEHVEGNTGIFLDVFPMDDVPSNVIGCIIHDIRCFLLRKTIWSRVGYKNSKGLTRLAFFFMKKVSIDSCYRRLERLASKSKNANDKRVRILMMPCDGKGNKKNNMKTRYGMKKEWITDRAEYQFEDGMFFGSRDYDACLKYLFDDYMTPPPEDKRQQHSPVSVLLFGDEK